MRKIIIKSEEQKHIEHLSDENAELLISQAMLDKELLSIKNENADLMLRIAMLEVGNLA